MLKSGTPQDGGVVLRGGRALLMPDACLLLVGVTLVDVFDAVLRDGTEFFNIYHTKLSEKVVELGEWTIQSTTDGARWGGTRQVVCIVVASALCMQMLRSLR